MKAKEKRKFKDFYSDLIDKDSTLIEEQQNESLSVSTLLKDQQMWDAPRS